MTLRVYVSGQKAFGAAAADLVRSTGRDLTGVASPAHGAHGPDRLRVYADRHGIPWTDAAAFTRHAVPPRVDVLIAAHSHAFIGRRTRATVRVAVGYHPSLLPLHRGRDAVRWTIRDHDKVTGGSVYHLTDTVDAGPLAAQRHVLIPPGSTPETLWRDHLAPLGLELLDQVLRDVEDGVVAYVPQREECATWEPSWTRPPLHRPELPELPALGPAPGLAFDADPAALRPR